MAKGTKEDFAKAVTWSHDILLAAYSEERKQEKLDKYIYQLKALSKLFITAGTCHKVQLAKTSQIVVYWHPVRIRKHDFI